MNASMQPAVQIDLHAARPSLDDRPLEKRVGLIILATDHTTEPDFRRMVACEQTGVYVARIPYANPTTPENLRKSTTATRLIARKNAPTSVIGSM